MKTRLLSAMAITAILFASCGSDENVEIPEVNDGRVKFSSGIVETKVSGPDGDIWSTLDRIGIYMVEHGTRTVKEGEENRKYRAENAVKSTSFTVAEGLPIYYPVDGTYVDFISYYPHTDAMDGYIYPVDLSDQSLSNLTNIDLMTASAGSEGTGFNKTDNQPVNLTFNHQLAKIVINVQRGNGISNDDLNNLTIKMEGMNTSAKFDITNPDAGFTDIDTPKDLTLTARTGNTKGGDAILLPVTLDNTHIVKFTIGSDTYTWNMTENTGNSGPITAFESGKKYTFTVTIEKTGVGVTGNINAWEPMGPVSGTAK